MKLKYIVPLLFAAVAALATLAFADQEYMPQGAAANMSRPCGFEGVTAQKVTVNGTSAATSTATGVGVVRVVCTTNAHFVQAETPVATANDAYISAGVPEYFYSVNRKLAFIQDSAGGFCFVSSCK